MSELMPAIIHYFRDTSDPLKCEGQVCQTMEGWYDDYPDRPHGGNCDCDILSYATIEEIVYKNYQELDGGEATYESENSDSYENPHPTAEVDMPITLSIEVKKTVEISIEEVMTHFGFSGSEEITETITREIHLLIPPMTRARINITKSGTVTHYTAEKWLEIDAEDYGLWDRPEESGEIFLETVEGGVMYEEGNQIDVEIEYEPM